MLMQSTPLFQALQQKMSWLQTRQRVLSENIANVDTPGYVPSDLKDLKFKNLVATSGKSLPLSTSAEGHLRPGQGGAAEKIVEQRDRKMFEVLPSGNAVTVEEQMKKSADTAMDYQLITNIYKKQIAMLRTAIGGRA